MSLSSKIMLSLLLLPVWGCAPIHENTTNIAKPTTSEKIYQVSTLDALTQGSYDGVISFKELLRHGDTGIGTLHTLDGELIVLDGAAYQVKNRGEVVKISEEYHTPFACVAFFVPDFSLSGMKDIPTIDALKSYLSSKIHEKNKSGNVFYMAKIHGAFSNIKLRSVPAQSKPYAALSKIQQNIFECENVAGTLIALYNPPFMDGLNLPGWHIHFLSDDHSRGGHVLDLAMSSGSGELDTLTVLEIQVPNTDEFAKLDLTKDVRADVAKVEAGK